MARAGACALRVTDASSCLTPATPKASAALSSAEPSPAYTLAAALAGCGAVENVYLTAVKLSGAAPALCSSAGAGCGGVLSSTWATLFGLPLSALGAATYAAVAATALVGASARAAGTPESLNSARVPLLAGATTLASVSGYLMFILATKLGGTACPYCLASAALSVGTLASAARGLSTDELKRLAAPGAALAAAVIVTVALPQARVRFWRAWLVTRCSRVLVLSLLHSRRPRLGWQRWRLSTFRSKSPRRALAAPIHPRNPVILRTSSCHFHTDLAAVHGRHARAGRAPVARRRAHVRRVLVQPLRGAEGAVRRRRAAAVRGVLP